MRKVIILIICLSLWLYGCNENDQHCGDDYDRCCDECYQYYLKTGLSTECYGSCYDKFAECEKNKDEQWGCFINSVKLER